MKKFWLCILLEFPLFQLESIAYSPFIISSLTFQEIARATEWIHFQANAILATSRNITWTVWSFSARLTLHCLSFCKDWAPELNTTQMWSNKGCASLGLLAALFPCNLPLLLLIHNKLSQGFPDSLFRVAAWPLFPLPVLLRNGYISDTRLCICLCWTSWSLFNPFLQPVVVLPPVSSAPSTLSA